MDVRSIAENIIDCKIGLVNIGERFRKDFGDIPALAQSIEEIGLLQPIGIDSGYRLVFGERRLRAFRHLGRDTIPARFVNLDSLLKGEYAENELRKDFTQSERVAIGRALEGDLAKRNGVRHDTSAAKENFPEVKGQTRDLAAKAAGFGNGKTYEQAKAVVDSGAPELIEAMDSGALSINLAAQVAALPDAERAVVAAAPSEEIKDVAREVVKKAHVANNSGNNEWYTPADYIALAREVMGGIDTDPATSEIANRTVQASQIFTAEDNGLTKQWSGRVWVNPPYSQPLIAEFAEAIASKYESGEIEQACVLVNNGTETAWFQRMLKAASAVCFPRSRIRFVDPDGNPSGAPLQGQAVLYLGNEPETFASVFSEKGAVLFNA